MHIALIKAKLETYLGFLHSVQFGQPSLVCYSQEFYRYLIDDFIIEYCKDVRANDFVLKAEDYSTNRKGERQYLSEERTDDLMIKLSRYFETRVEIPRIRRGEEQQIETLISEEAMLFAMHLRNERQTWNPRIANLTPRSTK
jgi:CRISPR/Cas system-associated endonuclease Cas1